jgi:predicted nuclease of predicted toxin-antitoxin system
MFLLDQNLRQTTVDFLRSLGFDAVSTRDLGLQHASDIQILAAAIGQRRLVLTYNADFGDVREFPPGTYLGVIRLRIHPQIDEVVHPILERVFDLIPPEALLGALTVVDNHKIRIRRVGQATKQIPLADG